MNKRISRRCLTTTAAALIAAASLSACGAGSKDCIVLANGGNTLCGQTASAWCQSTDPIRALDPNAPGVITAQADCDKIESDYPNG